MRLSSWLVVALSLLATSAWADSRCDSQKAQNACYLALHYEALSKSLLPMVGEDFGVRVRVLSATADGPQLVIAAKTAKSSAGLTRLLAEKNIELKELTDFWKGDAIDGVCQSVEGPDFLSAGGILVVVLTTSDRKPLMNFAIQSCAGA